jgi:hypothetical protein
VTLQRNEAREFALVRCCMDESSCERMRLFLTSRCAFVQVNMVGLAIQLIRYSDKLVCNDIVKGLNFRGTMIRLCDTWLLQRNFLTDLDDDNNEEASAIFPWCFWVENVVDVG